MPNYAKTMMYKLINYDCPELLYIGSTTNFIKRKQRHKGESKKSNVKVYRTIRENGGWESWSMIKISDFPCTSNIEARMEEDRLMCEMKSNLNSIKAYRSPEQKIEQNKQHYQDNKEDIKEHRTEKILCECGCTIRRGDISAHKKTIKHQKLLALAQ